MNIENDAFEDNFVGKYFNSRHLDNAFYDCSVLRLSLYQEFIIGDSVFRQSFSLSK